MDRLNPLLDRMRTAWAGFSPSTRLAVGASIGALLLALVFFGVMNLRPPTYGVLFSNLAADEANGVVSKLDAEKIPYRLSADGGTVMIPQEMIPQERVALAGTGVVKGGGTGFELFDRTNLGMTDTQEKIAKIRATEGELQRTIAGLTPVASARVHIAAPEASLYSTTQAPTTASVAVATKPGMTLSPQEVRGITQLVSGAVEGLKPEHVTIVNQDGTVLLPAPDPGSDTVANELKATGDQLQAKIRYEANLQESIQGMLDAAIGMKRSAVRVATDMSFDANQTETKSYAPSGTIRSSQTERENYNGTGANRPPAIGVPGTTTNAIPTYQTQSAGTGNSTYSKSKTTNNYEITESTAKHIDAPGKIGRISVAVLVNVPDPTATVNGQPQYALAPADVQKGRNVVAAAAGINAARGDVISVEAIPFAPPTEVGQRSGPGSVLGIPLPALIGVIVILALAAAGFAVVLARRRAMRALTLDLPSFDAALADELPSFEEHPMLDRTPIIGAPVRSAADLSREQMIEYVTTVAQESPDSLAKLVKLWLAE
jgi:flagellar M-ring protein FliF